MLSLESSTARMSNLARQEMYFDRFQDLDELVLKIEAVTAEISRAWPRSSSKPNPLPLPHWAI